MDTLLADNARTRLGTRFPESCITVSVLVYLLLYIERKIAVLNIHLNKCSDQQIMSMTGGVNIERIVRKVSASQKLDNYPYTLCATVNVMTLCNEVRMFCISSLAILQSLDVLVREI